MGVFINWFGAVKRIIEKLILVIEIFISFCSIVDVGSNEVIIRILEELLMIGSQWNIAQKWLSRKLLGDVEVDLMKERATLLTTLDILEEKDSDVAHQLISQRISRIGQSWIKNNDIW